VDIAFDSTYYYYNHNHHHHHYHQKLEESAKGQFKAGDIISAIFLFLPYVA